MEGLNKRELIFSNEYLVDLNGKQAAIRAGYSPKTAEQMASRLLRKVKVREFIDKLMKKRQEKVGITQERVLQELARIAFFDPKKLFDNEGNPIPITELDDDTAAVIAGLDLKEEYEGYGDERKFVGYTKKIKLSDKNSALNLAMRHLGMLNDNLNLNITEGLADRVARAKGRVNDN